MVNTEPDSPEGQALTQTALGRALNLSAAAVTKLKRQGMPVHSVEAAHAWRRDHLDPARRKRSRFDDELGTRARVARVAELMTAAEWALREANEHALSALLPELQRAMREVPEPARDRVRLSFDVMNVLCAPMIECLDRCEAEDLAQAAAAGLSGAEPQPEDPAGDDPDRRMGAFWYSVAAGEGNAAALRHLNLPEEGEAAG
jgi:hypothetical protein